MIITAKTTISFDSVKDRDSIKKFMEDNDMTEWIMNEDTLITSFTRTITYYQTRGEREVKTNGGTC